MNQKSPFFKTGKGLLVLGFVIVTIIGIPVTVFLLQQQQIFQQHAWLTSQSASAACDANGKVVITAQFSNTEPAGAQWSMNVLVSDAQTGGTANLGAIASGQTKSGTINTNLPSINAGGVVFTLTWTDGRSGKDTRTASYPAVAACAAPTPTNTPTVSLTNTPTVSPTNTPTVSPTETPTGTPTETPTGTIAVTDTPTPTVTEGSTATPTTEVFSSSTPTNTITTIPQPTIMPTGPANLLVSFGAIGLMLTLIGGLIFILL